MSSSLTLPQEQYLDAIRKEPESVANRRAYAEFLQSIGDPRGALIDLQCPPEESDFTERIFQAAKVGERIKTLARLERDRLNALFHLCIHRPVFDRGFITEADIPIREFTKNIDHVTREVPLLQKVHLGMGVKPEEIAQLKTCAFPKNLTGISFGTYYKQFPAPKGSGDACIKELLTLPNLPSLEYLSVGGSEVTNYGAHIIADSKKTRLLKHLRLSRNHIGDAGIEHLCNGHLNNLISLDVENNRLSANAIKILRTSALASQIERLNIATNDIGDEGLAILSEEGAWPKLTHLNIGWDRFSPGTIVSFLKSPVAVQLVDLNLSHHQLNTDVLKALAKVPLPNLRTLTLEFTGLSEGTIRALAASGNLRHCILDVSGNSWPKGTPLPPGFTERPLDAIPSQKYYDEVLIG